MKLRTEISRTTPRGQRNEPYTDTIENNYKADDSMLGASSLLSAATIIGDEVCNMRDEKLGKIEDVVIDTVDGRIRYAVLSLGGFLGMGDRLFCVPWTALKLDMENQRFVLKLDAKYLKNAPASTRING